MSDESKAPPPWRQLHSAGTAYHEMIEREILARSPYGKSLTAKLAGTVADEQMKAGKGVVDEWACVDFGTEDFTVMSTHDGLTVTPNKNLAAIGSTREYSVDSGKSWKPVPSERACAEVQEVDAKRSASELRRHIMYTRRAWPRCEKHGCELEVHEGGIKQYTPWGQKYVGYGGKGSRLVCPVFKKNGEGV